MRVPFDSIQSARREARLVSRRLARERTSCSKASGDDLEQLKLQVRSGFFRRVRLNANQIIERLRISRWQLFGVFRLNFEQPALRDR